MSYHRLWNIVSHLLQEARVSGSGTDFLTLRTIALAGLVGLAMAPASGCKKDDAPPASGSATQTPPTNGTTSAPADSQSPAPQEAPTTDSGETEKPAPEKPAPEAAGVDKGEPAPVDPNSAAAHPKAAEVEKLVRDLFADLEREDYEAAANRMLTAEQCMPFWDNEKTCGDIVKGWQQGLNEVKADPVPKGSVIKEFHLGERQEITPEMGAKVKAGIWVGAAILGETPEGHQFVMRSLGLLETEQGLRAMWGKRRAGADTPRNPKNIPGAAAAGALSPPGTAPAPSDSAKPSSPSPPTPSQPTPPQPTPSQPSPSPAPSEPE